MTTLEFPPDTADRRTVEPGAIIFLEGQPADKAYVILKGHAEVVVRDSAGKLIPINRMNPGELFGELALLRDDNKRTATVVAVDRCELLEINRQIFDSRIAKSDPLIRFVLEHLTQRLVRLADKSVGDKQSK